MMNEEATTDDPLQGASDDIVALQEEIAKLKEMAARSQADLQNAKERLEREKKEMSTFAIEGALTTILPTIDNFQRAVDHIPEDIAEHDWVKGILGTEQELMKNLSGLGMTKMECLGEPVDTAKHEVLQVAEGEEGIIVEVFADGYEFNGKVLRAAKVVVGGGVTEASNK